MQRKAAEREGGGEGRKIRSFLGEPERPKVLHFASESTEAAKIGGVTVQIVRDWVLKFNAHGPEGLLNRKAPGQPSRLKDEHRMALTRMG